MQHADGSRGGGVGLLCRTKRGCYRHHRRHSRTFRYNKHIIIHTYVFPECTVHCWSFCTLKRSYVTRDIGSSRIYAVDSLYPWYLYKSKENFVSFDTHTRAFRKILCTHNRIPTLNDGSLIRYRLVRTTIS